MSKHFLRAAQFCLILLVASVLALPATSVYADGKSGDEEVAGQSSFQEKPSYDEFEAQFLQEANCTWTCADGRTGEAEVITADQCEAACEGACGGNCEPV